MVGGPEIACFLGNSSGKSWLYPRHISVGKV
jgi:hypothetical protein